MDSKIVYSEDEIPVGYAQVPKEELHIVLDCVYNRPNYYFINDEIDKNFSSYLPYLKHNGISIGFFSFDGFIFMCNSTNYILYKRYGTGWFDVWYKKEEF